MQNWLILKKRKKIMTDFTKLPRLVAGINEKISQLIEINLRRSGLFNPLNKDSFVRKLFKESMEFFCNSLLQRFT